MFLDENLKAGLRALKDRDGVPAAEAVRRAVAEYLEKRGIRTEAVRSAPRRAQALGKAQARQQRLR